MKKVIYFTLFLFTSCRIFGQDKDSVKQKELTRMLLKVDFACATPSLRDNYGFVSDKYFYASDSLLKDFYIGIDRTGHFNISGKDTFLYLQQLLNKAKNVSETSCFLPFLKLYDKTAEDVHYYTCFMSSYKVPHKIYCGVPPIQFIVLFVIQHTIVVPYKLNNRKRFEDIELHKNGSDLGQPDYDTVYQLYQNYIVDRFQKKNFDTPLPLSSSPYNWVITTSNKLTMQELKKLERWRNPKY